MLGYNAHSSPLGFLKSWVPGYAGNQVLVELFCVLAAKQPGEHKEECQEQQDINANSLTLQSARIRCVSQEVKAEPREEEVEETVDIDVVE